MNTKSERFKTKLEVQLHLNSSKSWPITLIEEIDTSIKLRVKISNAVQYSKNSDLTNAECIWVKNLRKYPFQPVVQSEFGDYYDKNGILTFSFQVEKLADVNLIISLFTEEDNSSNCQLHSHGFVDRKALKMSSGCLHIPLINPSSHRLVGFMSVDYLLIKLKNQQERWKTQNGNFFAKKTLNIGHRGSGASFSDVRDRSSGVTENTVKSINTAAEHGADYVEFDVHMTKDHVPVVFHDFHTGLAVVVNDHSKSVLQFPVNNLTYEELNKFVTIGESTVDSSEARLRRTAKDPDEKMFPSLKEVLERCSPDLGFLIELKYPQMLKDGTHELETPVDQNIFLDGILDVVYQYRGKRKIIFGCFEPHIVAMLNAKQSDFPILFITSGENDLYVPYQDIRTIDLMTGMAFAMSEKLVGISVLINPIKDKIKDVHQMMKENGLKFFTWGTDNNDLKLLNLQRDTGVDGIVYDRVAEFSDLISPKKADSSIPNGLKKL